MKLWEYEGKNVRIIMTDGEVFNGFAHDYIAAEDNEPYSESISIDNVELFANEIKSIELL